ncbi:oleosin-B2-like isoform X2 [Brassica napus]|uniref:oleosin-B2-like isoform X2 n=1 Tax=Brassica napus TaxID=3708 RepID=UPI00207A8781|nr:oleosin-B2-like isoform X2 [Brassica napus]
MISGELCQSEYHSHQLFKFNIFLEMFSFLIPVWDANKVTIASVASVVFLAFAGLTLAVSAVALVVSAPLFIIFSPILVPATIATTLLATGFTAGATLALTAIGLIIGLIKTAEGTRLALSAQRPLKLLKFSDGYWGFWGGKTFSGSFGDILKWLQKQPWFKGIPAGGAAPAAGGAEPPAAEAAPPAGGAAPPAGGAAPPAAGGAAPPAAGGAAPPAAGGAAPPPAGGAAPSM